jgi:hypothetical protein
LEESWAESWATLAAKSAFPYLAPADFDLAWRLAKKVTQTKSAKEYFEDNRRFWDIIFEKTKRPILCEVFRQLDDRSTRYNPLLLKLICDAGIQTTVQINLFEGSERLGDFALLVHLDEHLTLPFTRSSITCALRILRNPLTGNVPLATHCTAGHPWGACPPLVRHPRYCQMLCTGGARRIPVNINS